jgi:hypothetical protein
MQAFAPLVRMKKSPEEAVFNIYIAFSCTITARRTSTDTGEERYRYVVVTLLEQEKARSTTRRVVSGRMSDVLSPPYSIWTESVTAY